ncbi:LysM peptidoglycan-binding domain-containing protein [Abiotrophia sp.]|uniref:LysM peptidoglycan-binding domain-containing protein n=1 Tax=Abiotrophia sp. TaxID=76631 RepID=UPI001CAC8DA7|nr:LysM peptidoglycan-binding domain-containing protein [Abiotrophia sp.]MBF0935919.1 LysM peptidoglycan-binding domain-containing protein [Abiotrophia sp.]
MKLTLKRTLLLTSAAALLALPLTPAQAQEASQWTPRTVSQIKEDISKQADKLSYTVQYGDTLSAIAEALEVDLQVLVSINEIADADLIFPGTVLTATLDSNHKVTSLEIQTPDQNQESPSVRADLTQNTITIDGQTSQVDFNQNQATAPTNPQAQALVEESPVQDQEAASQDLSPVTQIPGQPEAVTPAQPTATSPQTPNNQVKPTNLDKPVTAQTPAKPESPAQPQNQANTDQAPVIGDDVKESGLPTVQEEARPQAPTQANQPEKEASDAAPTNPTGVNQSNAPTDGQESPQSPSQQAEANPTAQNQTTQEQPASTDYAARAAANPANQGLQPKAAEYKEEVADKFGVTNFSLYRPGSNDDHGKGLAVDFVVNDNTELGDQIANYATSDMESNDINYVIWKQRFYANYDSYYGPANTWNLMPDRGGDTANHYDHVHVSFNP